jgi:hypothetical protein
MTRPLTPVMLKPNRFVRKPKLARLANRGRFGGMRRARREQIMGQIWATAPPLSKNDCHLDRFTVFICSCFMIVAAPGAGRATGSRGVARAFIEGFLRRGLVAFPLGDLLKETGLSALAARRQLVRLGAWVVKVSRKEFYLIVSPEHRAMGAPPAAWWLDDYFRWLGHPYYLGLQSAAAVYGAEPQALQVVQVMTDCARKELDFGRVRIRFFLKGSAAQTPTQPPPRARAPLRVSTPAATALDLIRYSSRIGGLSRAWETFSPLLPQITQSDLRKALDAEDEPALGQRLGYLLEKGGNKPLAGVVAAWLPSVPPWALLEPGAEARGGPRLERWRLLQNSEA